MVAALATLPTYKDLPGPPGPPWVGNLFQIRFDAFHSTLENWADEYGPLYRFRVGPRKIAVISDADTIKTYASRAAGHVPAHTFSPPVQQKRCVSKDCFHQRGTTGVVSASWLRWR